MVTVLQPVTKTIIATGITVLIKFNNGLFILLIERQKSKNIRPKTNKYEDIITIDRVDLKLLGQLFSYLPLLPCKKKLPIFGQLPHFIVYQLFKFVDMISNIIK